MIKLSSNHCTPGLPAAGSAGGKPVEQSERMVRIPQRNGSQTDGTTNLASCIGSGEHDTHGMCCYSAAPDSTVAAPNISNVPF